MFFEAQDAWKSSPKKLYTQHLLEKNKTSLQACFSTRNRALWGLNMEYIPMASMNSGVVFCVEFQWEASVELWVLCPLLLMMLMLQGRANEEMKWITPYTGSSPNHNRRKRWSWSSWRKMREASFGMLGTPNICPSLITTLCLQELGFSWEKCVQCFLVHVFFGLIKVVSSSSIHLDFQVVILFEGVVLFPFSGKACLLLSTYIGPGGLPKPCNSGKIIIVTISPKAPVSTFTVHFHSV